MEEHGTVKGFMQHVRNGETACDSCKLARKIQRFEQSRNEDWRVQRALKLAAKKRATARIKRQYASLYNAYYQQALNDPDLIDKITNKIKLER